MKILAGIVLYNPDIERLKENIDAIIAQVDRLILYDNHSDNIEVVKKTFCGNEKLELICNDNNDGISAALARIMEYAEKSSFDWVLTLDQDSVCKEGLVEKYVDVLKNPEKWDVKCDHQMIGLLTCNIVDRNYEIDNDIKPDEKTKIIERCITAGSFMNTSNYFKSEGFDEYLFIDGVDFDICYNLRKHGLYIVQVNYDGVLQEIGSGKIVRLLWKKYPFNNHSPLRNYYMARNDFIIHKKYPDYISGMRTIARELKSEAIILIYGKQKFRTLCKRWSGIRDGLSYHIENK